MRSFVRRGVKITTMTSVSRLEGHNNRIKATLWSPFTMADCGERIVDMVVVENATVPLDDLYFALKEGSVNRGEVDYLALIAGRPQTLSKNPQGKYQLFRVGDAVSSRNIHAAIYDGLRFAKSF
jgi:N-methyl-L-proline demethylase